MVVISPMAVKLEISLPDEVVQLFKPVSHRSLKAVLGESMAETEPEPSESAPPSNAPAPHVLVAEDDPVNQIIVQAMLNELGATSVVAADGQQALDCLRTTPFDLVLMDMQMPRLDGASATQALRSRETNSGGRRLAVIAMTANPAEEGAVLSRSAGMDGFLAKPFGIADLRKVLADWT